ncbi:hypothetical protein [Bacillus alveayuensis]|jgi:hypothetical protein|uniref:YhjD n=1 Tax=Aeribacillus alveayuensis TaxID=279215 RepID=A0ABT9VNR3_9BACI|nr:hypothetical protein [Bacillus alveayuensis]MDQ0162360.1 hypothetical protein [Bacillus alveayuensis]
MSRIPDTVRDLIEQAIYLPMTITVLNRDLTVVENSPFKLKQPYLHIIEEAIKLAQKDLALAKRELRKQNVKVLRLKRDEAFTLYGFYYKGYEEQHNYFNPRIRNKVAELIEYYLFKAEKD